MDKTNVWDLGIGGLAIAVLLGSILMIVKGEQAIAFSAIEIIFMVIIRHSHTLTSLFVATSWCGRG
ncbi:hypothetical protein [Nostoc sp. FACHB-110]|uniref:hypothetical protein n=1 Tax=Nostoc sp. FACHB-110 TaxID=2692834 RepID=UPI0016838152|nr:hypothetical protein [Nostoc sp. FACHB-110]MBD2440620.1 hypothetical protein [Nostoc sp. FACHB-110]